MEYEEDCNYWEEWRHVEYLTLKQAASMLSGVSPALDNTFALDARKPMLEALRQAVILNKLKPFRLYEWKGVGYDAWLKSIDEITPETVIAEESTFLIADLTAWADSKGIPHHWSHLQSDEADNATATSKSAPAIPYTEELQAAIDAYEAVRGNPAAWEGTSPKRALLAWLEENRANLGSKARERIATVCNWEPQGGAPQTPTGRGSQSSQTKL